MDTVRDFFEKNRWVALILFVLITALSLFGNKITKQGGILDDTIINQDDIFYKSDKHVRSRTEFEEFIPIFLTFPQGISSKKDLKKIISWTKKGEALFGNSVLSLSTYPNFIENNGEIRDDYFIAPDTLHSISIKKWKESIEKDPAVFGFLVEKDWSWALVIINIKPGYDDLKMFWKIAELLEERVIPWWERLYKTDIYPADKNIMAGSWVIGRGTIYRTLPFEMNTRVTGGLCFVFFLFFLILRSFSQAFCATALIGVSILWTRGSIGILDWLGFSVKERVYVLVVFSNCIVQGVSFSLHKFEEFNKTGSWHKARSVDMLIFNTTVIAFFGFLTLWSFELVSIRELGLLSALGVVYLFILSVFFLPSITVTSPGKTSATGLSLLYSSLVSRLATFFVKFAGISLGKHLFLLMGLFTIALLLVLNGKIVVGSTPYAFIPGTLSEKTNKYLNQPGKIGGENISIMVEPSWTNTDGMYNPRFIGRLAAFGKDIQDSISDIRRVSFVINSINKLSMEMYNKKLPETDEEVDSIFFFLEEGGVSQEISEQSWFDNGARLTVFDDHKNSIELGILITRILQVAEDYPELKIYPFGKTTLYQREDKYIREGKPRNLFASQLVVIIFCFFIIIFKGRRLGSHRLSPWKGAIIMSTPFVFASSVVVIVMALLHIPLDVATAVTTALAINASIDFSVYYVDAYQEALVTSDGNTAIRNAMESEGEVIINDILLNSVCFFPLVFSSFIPISRLGWVMVAMVITAGIGSLAIMPVLLKYAVKKEEKIL